MTYFRGEVRLRDLPKMGLLAWANLATGLFAFAFVGVLAAQGELATLTDVAILALLTVAGTFNLYNVDQELREVSA